MRPSTGVWPPASFFLICCLASGRGWSQPHPQPHYTTETYAGLMEVRVTDSASRVVRGLRQADLLVSEDGKDRPLLLFEESGLVTVSVAILLDVGSAMSAEAILTGREMAFRLIHELQPEDDFLLAVFGRDVHFLTELTADRHELTEALWNISPGDRKGKLSRLGRLFVSDSYTGYAVDMALLKLKRSNHSNKIVLVFSAGFGNIGEATLDHLHLAGTRFFAVSVDNKLGDVFSLGGDQMARKRIVQETGGLSYSAHDVLERIDHLRDALKHYYLIAYEPARPELSWEKRKVQVRIRGHPEYVAHPVFRSASGNSFY